MRLSRTLAAALLLVAAPAHAYLDLMLESTGRHYPLGGATYLEAGDSRLLWGGRDGRPPEGAAYGYWRPSLGVTYADYYRGARAQIDLFPVAFLGLRAGARLVDNDGDYPAFNCGTGGDRCRGRYTAPVPGSPPPPPRSRPWSAATPSAGRSSSPPPGCC